MPETYDPGQRKRKYGQNHQITEDRAAWVICESGKFVILVGPDEGSGSDVVIHHPRPGKIPDTSIHLANLTEQELDALEELFKSAFAWARPVVRQRDKEAKDAWEKGDDSYVRIYRAVPTVVYRKRPEPEYSEGVPERPEGVPASGGREQPDFAGGIRGARYELAQLDEAAGFPEDNGTPPDLPEELRQVGEDGSSS